MSDVTELAQRMKAAALKATQGEWWSDVVETDGEYGDGEDRESGFHSYAVYDAQGRSLLDMTNSTAATIQTEWDRDYHLAWDVVGEHNAKHIIASQPQNVLALVEALEARDKQIAEDAQIKARLCRESNSLFDRLRAAEKHIAELEESHAQVIQSRDHYKRMSEEGLKAIRESRTVKLPKPISVLHRRDFNDAHQAIYAYPEAEVNAALASAGIQVIEGER